MIFPIESLLHDSRTFGLVVAVLLGFSFGFVLERAGFGRSTKLAGQFYLHDMTVLKVMFSAIVVAMLGIVLAGGVGLVDVESLVRSGASFTYVGPMIIGGLLLGVGFVVSGYCPGTSIVATASGHIDGLFALVGIVIGSLVFGEVYPWVADFHVSGNLGHLFLPEVLGLSRALVAVLVTLMAIGMFLGAEKLEQLFKRDNLDDSVKPTQSYRVQRVAFSVLILASVLGVATLLSSPEVDARESNQPIPVTAEALARRILEQPWTMRIIDLRDQDAWIESRVPGSESVPEDQLDSLGLEYIRDGRDLVLVSAADLGQAPPAATGYSGRVYSLVGGFPEWNRLAAEEPSPPAADASPDERAQYTFRAAVHSLMTGQTAAPPPVPVVRTGGPRPTGGGGCD